MNNPLNPILSTLKATNWGQVGRAAGRFAPETALAGSMVGLIAAQKGHKGRGTVKGFAYGGVAGAVGAAGASMWAQRALRAAM